MLELKTPLCSADLEKLKAGDRVFLSGIIYTARDAAHRRLVQAIEEGKPLPFDLQGSVIFYVGPTPAPPGKPIGSAGPTTSGRMDTYTPLLLEKGVKAIIGKGKRSGTVREALSKFKGVYFVATGGAGALLSQRIKAAEVIAYEDLGPEAVHRLEVENFPLFVSNDMHGNDVFQQGTEKYRIPQRR